MSKPNGCGSLSHLPSMILDQMSDAVIATDRDGRIAFWNRAAERLFHLPAQAVLGRHPHDVPLSPWFSPADEDAVVSAGRHGEVLRREGVHSNGNGRTLHLELVIAALSGTDGVPAGMLVIVRDISTAKRNERDPERQADAVRGAPDRFHPTHGLIPVCSHCKQIRDREGSWHEVEAYFHDQFGFKFTHGICPACITRLNSDYGSPLAGA